MPPSSSRPAAERRLRGGAGHGLVNRKLAEVETLFLPADPVLEHISSSIVKDVARHGGDVTGMVPDGVVPMLDEALNHERGE